MGIFNESYINELFGLKKKQLPPFPRRSYDMIMEKYGSKQVQPPTDVTNIGICAYIFCDYTTKDMDKFCNSKDTLWAKKRLQISISEYKQEYKRNPSNVDIKRELDAMEELFEKIRANSVCFVINDSNDDGKILYFKDLHSLVAPNNDEPSFHKVDWDSVEESIKMQHKYDFDHVEDQ